MGRELDKLWKWFKDIPAMGAREVIDVSAIDRCVCFFKLGSSQYVIIDREGQAMI